MKKSIDTQKISKNKKRRALRKTWVVALCYGAFLALWLLLALVRFVGDSARNETQLTLDAATVQNLLPLHIDGVGAGFISENEDPQMMFEPIDERVRLVRFSAQFMREAGEMELFYTRKEGQGFSVAKRVIGVLQSDGSYLYALPAGEVHALRIDPGTQGGNEMIIDAVTLNPKLSPSYYFVPTLRDVMAFIIWPALWLCILWALLPLWRKAKAAVQKKWQGKVAGGKNTNIA